MTEDILLPELFLVPRKIIREFRLNNKPQHTWKKLLPIKIDSDDPLEKAKTAYHLISPQPSSNWGTYLTLRQERDRIFETEINKEFSGEELCASLLQVRQALTAVLANTNFTEEQQAAIFDSIVPVAFYTEESGFGKELVRMSSHSIRRAGSLTRDISHRK